MKNNSRFSFLSILFVSLSALILTACSSGIKDIVEPPKVQVHKVELGNFDLRGGTATFILDIQNPNRFSIPLAGFDYGLRLNGVSVAQGEKAHKVTIKAGESQKIAVPLSVSFTNMANMLPNLLQTGKMNYQLAGSVHLPWFNIPFQRTGSANIR